MWFYRYLIRGLGLVLIVGMLIILALAIQMQFTRQPAEGSPHSAPVKPAGRAVRSSDRDSRGTEPDTDRRLP